jgi:hypothetical protein
MFPSRDGCGRPNWTLRRHVNQVQPVVLKKFCPAANDQHPGR